MPEPIPSVSPPGTNICQLEESDAASTTLPPTPSLLRPQTKSNLEPLSDPAVGQLVKAHPSSANAGDCRAEGVALGTAGVKAAISLGAVLLSAPTEVGLPLTIGRFVVEAMLLGAAAASYENCKDAATTKAK